jgi:hypothetical protein
MLLDLPGETRSAAHSASRTRAPDPWQYARHLSVTVLDLSKQAKSQLTIHDVDS